MFIGLLCELLLRAWWALAFWDRRLGFFMLHGQRTLLPVARDHCTPWAPFFLFLVLSFTFSNFVRFFFEINSVATSVAMGGKAEKPEMSEFNVE